MSLCAMILAAGRGSGMRHLTDDVPKPLIKVNHQALIIHQIEALVRRGVKKIIINVAYLAQMIVDHVGFCERWGIEIIYLYEKMAAYDTGGGVRRALKWLSDPFILVNADVYSDYDYKRLFALAAKQSVENVHLVLVPNPAHNPKGDFALSTEGVVQSVESTISYTYAGISLLTKQSFNSIEVGQKVALPAIWQALIEQGQVTGELHMGSWYDVGTPERWQVVNR